MLVKSSCLALVATLLLTGCASLHSAHIADHLSKEQRFSVRNSVPFINGGHHVTLIPEMSTVMSLGLIVVSLVVAAAFSLLKTRNDVATPSNAGVSGD